MNTIDIIDTNAHYYNLGKIEGTMWKHKINKQSGLIDERSIYLFKYLSKERKAIHNDNL